MVLFHSCEYGLRPHALRATRHFLPLPQEGGSRGMALFRSCEYGLRPLALRATRFPQKGVKP